MVAGSWIPLQPSRISSPQFLGDMKDRPRSFLRLTFSSGVRSFSVFQLPAKWWMIKGGIPSFGSSRATWGEALTLPAAQTQTFHFRPYKRSDGKLK